MADQGSGDASPQPSWLYQRCYGILCCLVYLFVFLSFIFSPVISLLLCYWLYHSLLWPMLFVYIAWIYFVDWDTPRHCGRQATPLRRSSFLVMAAGYFSSCRIVRTADMHADSNYILVAHPHGLTGVSYFMAFCTKAAGLDDVFPGVRFFPITLPYIFLFPFVRELFIGVGGRDCNRQTIKRILTKKDGGNGVVLIPGAANEAFHARPGGTTLYLKRKGFVRLALETGASIVPVYSFGENELFNQINFSPDSLPGRIQAYVLKQFRLALVVFYGRFFVVPHPVHMSIVCGTPIVVPKTETPSEDQVDKYHQLYVKGLIKVFNENKEKYNVDPHATLNIL